MTWIPHPGWVSVRPVATEDTIGSLVIPRQAIDRMTRTQYEVVASGGAVVLEEEPETPSGVAPGDWILAPPRLAFTVIEEGVTLLSERHIWAILG